MRERTPILCVDDEPAVLEALRDSLRRHFEVHTATSGAAGLELIAAAPERFRIVISDLRMPGQSGASFLAEVRRVAPRAVRILLTGHSDAASAIKAVNEGQIFRFLAKPCERDELLRACAAALHHHGVTSAQSVALDGMRTGVVSALEEMLAHTRPDAHRSALRARRLAEHLLAGDDGEQAWAVRTAATLAYLGAAPSDEPGALPDLEAAQRILAAVPRMDDVLTLLDEARSPSAGVLERPASLVATAIAYAGHEARGLSPEEAVSLLREDPDRHGAASLDEFQARLDREARESVQAIAPSALRPGMELVEDLRTDAGGMLVPRGATLTSALLERLEHVLAQQRSPVKVALRPQVAA